MISGLGKRQFVLHSTKAKAPSVFTTRWAMSYLAGPLTRDEVKSLSGPTSTNRRRIPPPQPSTLGAARRPRT